jgi:uncharacterized protein YeeX (DUF496 family)
LNTQPQIIVNENKNFYEYKIDDFVIKDTKDIKKLSQKLEIAI